MEKVDIIIIGAGPAGAVAAAHLIKKGNNVLVLEKEEFPRFVIGESLLPQCMNSLQEVDLLDAVKKAKFQVKKAPLLIMRVQYLTFLFLSNILKGGNGLSK